MTAGVCAQARCAVLDYSRRPSDDAPQCILAPGHAGPCTFPTPSRRRRVARGGTELARRSVAVAVEPGRLRRDADDLDLVGVLPELAADAEVAALADLGSVRVRYLPRCKRCGLALDAARVVPMVVLDRNGGLSAAFCAVDCAIGWLRELREDCGA